MEFSRVVGSAWQLPEVVEAVESISRWPLVPSEGVRVDLGGSRQFQFEQVRR